MTPLNRKLHRVTSTALDGSYGPDRNRRIVITLIPGDGKDIHDLIEVRPYGTRRGEKIRVSDVYRHALRCRANLEYLEKARKAKERKAIRLASQRQARHEKKLRQPIRA